MISNYIIANPLFKTAAAWHRRIQLLLGWTQDNDNIDVADQRHSENERGLIY